MAINILSKSYAASRLQYGVILYMFALAVGLAYVVNQPDTITRAAGIVAILFASVLPWLDPWVFYCIFVALIPMGLLGRVGDTKAHYTLLPLVGLLLALVWFMRYIRKQPKILLPREFRIVIALALWVLASHFINSGLNTFNLVYTGTLLMNILLVFLTFQIVTNTKRVRTLAWILVATNLLSAILYLAMHYELVSLPGISSVQGRTRGLLGDVNFTGFFFSVNSFWCLYLLGAGIKRLARLACWAALLLSIFATMVTASVTAAVTIGFIIMPTILGVRRLLSPKMLLAGAIVFLLFWAAPFLQQGILLDRLQYKLTEFQGGDWRYWGSRRGALWEGGYLVVLDHPIMGDGARNYMKDLVDNLSQEWVRYQGWWEKVAHNSYLDMAAAFGIPAAVMFAAYLILLWRGLQPMVRQERARSPGQRWPPYFILNRMLLAMVLYSMNFLMFRTKYFWINLAMINLLISGLLASRESAATGPEPPPDVAPRRDVSGLLTPPSES
jgi:O-antigen ligase